ncbi:SH2 domain containing 3Cb isoform X2 [Hippocampus comes]|uniref:SH2 domain containing 3Cb isoform X2 n=1 Tax=Hippocampus comes TaxID=109280 RepID=UPI00094ED9E5|nr:PREDICTED: SH2 domain-containing protein 3C-like isoform X2 [Hippocampus comes]
MKRHKHSPVWLGSLASLSKLRRPSSRRKASAPPQTWPADDSESGPQPRGYARSSAMYTHVGTVPRGGRQLSGMDKKEEGDGEEKGTDDCVRDSPLLGALSSLSLNAPEQPGFAPAPPGMDQGPAAARVMSKGAPAVSKRNSTPTDVRQSTPAPQDVYVHMDALGRHETTKDSPEVENLSSPTNGGGEYVKFSKDKKFCLEKQLQEELQLSAANLRSHAWYHGPITRQVAERLVLNQGDFLIRDSESSPGNFVLTARWDQETNHFPVRTTVVHCGVHYSLDREVFDSLPALVRFCAASRAPLTCWSAAKIQQPVNRTLPLSYLQTAIAPPPCQLTPSRAEEVCSKSPSSLRRRDRRQPAFSSSTDDITLQSTDAAPSPSPSPPERDPDIQPPDSDGGCYTEVYPGPRSFVERLRDEEGQRAMDVYLSPMMETASSFAPTSYRSPLMPGENKPLEVGILQRVKELLAGADPQTAARHITKWDCTVAQILEARPELQRLMGVSSGMELLTLPHGQQLRLDLLERLHTMAIMLAVNVLGCTGTTEERASALHRMIGIAAELKCNMGNMFGFSAVMRALELPQVSRLEQTWMALRQRHTEDAVLYEKILRPFLKGLNEGRESCPASGTTFPHVLPLLCLLEKSVALDEGPPGAEETPGAEAWETAEAGADIEVLMFHLGAARKHAQLGAVYGANARSKLQDFQERADFSEVFCTDFQIRLLWGSRGAAESRVRRYAKFNQVLTALSNRLEPPPR